jgi:hypothetical protein
MSYWTKSTATPTGRKLVKDWAINFVAQTMNNEARKVTKLGLFRSSRSSITPEWVRSFNPSDTQDRLKSHCPVTFQVLQQLATSSRQPKSSKWASIKRKKDKVVI